jgi:hypothetical protein
MQSLEDLLPLFESYRKTNSGYLVTCPVHDDKNPSLHIAIGVDGSGKDRLLVKCFSGCDSEDVLKYINDNKNKPNLNNKKQAAKKSKPTFSTLIKTYNYRDITGKMVYQVLRYHPKDFKFRRPTDDLENYPSGYIWSIGDSDKFLYNLDRVASSISTGEYVWKVEGEKDADALTEAGFTATCNLFGATPGKWRHEYCDQLSGANLVCVPDEDETGYIHVFEIVRDLLTNNSCKSIRIIFLPVSYHGDISDYLDSGKSVYDLLSTAIDVSKYTIEQLSELLYITKKPNGSLLCSKFIGKSEYDIILDSNIISDNTVQPTKSVSKLEQTVLYTKALEILKEKGPMAGLCEMCLGSGFVMGSNEDVFGVLASNNSSLLGDDSEEHQNILLETCLHGNVSSMFDTKF